MKKLTIADIKATEILSKEERKIVMGGNPGSGTCFDNSTCPTGMHCIRTQCVNSDFTDTTAQCFVVTWHDSEHSAGELCGYFDDYNVARNYAFNVGALHSVSNISIHSC